MGPPFAGRAPVSGAPPAALRSDFVGMKTRFVGLLATPAGFEPATPSLEGWRSKQYHSAASTCSLERSLLSAGSLALLPLASQAKRAVVGP